jgi:hypothetical protein
MCLNGLISTDFLKHKKLSNQVEEIRLQVPQPLVIVRYSRVCCSKNLLLRQMLSGGTSGMDRQIIANSDHFLAFVEIRAPNQFAQLAAFCLRELPKHSYYKRIHVIFSDKIKFKKLIGNCLQNNFRRQTQYFVFLIPILVQQFWSTK